MFFNSPEEIFQVAKKHGQDLAETQIAKTGDRITKDTMYRRIDINSLESGIGNPAAGKYALK